MASFRSNRIAEWVMLLGVVVVLLGVVVGVFQVYETATNAHKALCALRAERIRGIVDGKRFLERHPHGVSGISREDIMRSIETQKETVRAFRFADC